MDDINTVIVERVEWAEYIEILRDIRSEVFIIEQQVPRELEWDDFDETAVHVLARVAGEKPVGTGRLLASGQIGRMAVLKPYRRHGVGTAIMKELMRLATDLGWQPLFLNAQVDAIAFYRQFGFVAQDPEFMEAGIAHKKMILGTAGETSNL